MSRDVDSSRLRDSHFQSTLLRFYISISCTHTNIYCVYLHICDSNLEQVEDLLAQVQLKVCVVRACHVVDEHQAVPLGLKAVKKEQKT